MHQVFLPIIMMTLFIVGVQDETLGAYATKYIPNTFVYIAARWDVIEFEKGVYDWQYLDATVLKMPQENRLIIGAKTSPVWARKYVPPCSQPKPEYYQDYADFVKNIAMRYPAVYGVEIWNEPDAPPNVFPDDHWLYGCWDDGAAYRNLLYVVYPNVKEFTKVIAGAVSGAGVFSEVALWDDRYYDIVSYHAYANQNVENWSKIVDTGLELRKLTGKPLIVTETALLGYICDEQMEIDKLAYLRYVIDHSYTSDISGFLWYTVGGNDWRCSDLFPGASYTLMFDTFVR